MRRSGSRSNFSRRKTPLKNDAESLRRVTKLQPVISRRQPVPLVLRLTGRGQALGSEILNLTYPDMRSICITSNNLETCGTSWKFMTHQMTQTIVAGIHWGNK